MRERILRAGQRVVVGFDGHAVSPDLRRLLRDYGAGALILFARNVDTPEQVAELVREAQSVARDSGHERPLLVAVDQEGGRVARLRAPWTEWPPLRAIGRAASADLARKVGEALAEELGACGIRWDFAPVVDVDTNPRNPVIGDRSLGDDPGLVGRLAAEIIRGMQGRGVAACAKHFPGLGDSELDPHLDLPALDHSRSRLDDIELRPFRAAAEAGVASVMTAHVMARELDDQLPATLSARVLSDLLRDEMGYDGLVVSDDLEMKAVSARWGPGVAAVLAVKAGCDMVIVSRDHDAQVEAVEGMVRAMETGEISWRAADDAARRIREIKERFLLPYADPSPAEARAAAGSQERWALARTLADLGGVAV